MYIQLLIGGLISILTPSVFLMTLILIIALSKINLTKESTIYVNATFCALIVFFYVIIGVVLKDITPSDLAGFSSSFTIKYIFVILNIILGLWLLGVFKIISSNIESEWIFKSLMIGIMSIVFTASSFSGTGQIISVFIIINSELTTLIDIVIPLLIFAIGLIIPIGIIVFFMSKFMSKNKEKKWLKILQLLTGSIVITATIIGLFVD